MFHLCTLIGEVVDCGTLDDPANGQVLLSGTTVGATATYTCFVGYVASGDVVRHCQSNGQWTGVSAKCMRESHM